MQEVRIVGIFKDVRSNNAARRSGRGTATLVHHLTNACKMAQLSTLSMTRIIVLTSNFVEVCPPPVVRTLLR